MTDEQIFENGIKCVIRRSKGVCNGGSNCIKCDLLMDSEEIVKCYDRAIKNIELTNHQKAKIEELKDIIAKVPTNAYDLQVEASEKLENQIKSEAIKEFARELKCGVPQETGVIRCKDIDTLVKEMTEGNNDRQS